MGGEPVDVDRLAGLVTAAADRLRSLPQSKLAGPAEAGRQLARWLAGAGAGVEQRDAAQPPTAPPVPRLGIFAVGDQVAVTGNDLVAAGTGLDPDVGVWAPDGTRTRLATVLAAAADGLQDLRGRC